MKKLGETFKGKCHDKYFEWSDEKIYCSELVWKLYKQAVNIELGSPEKLSDFNLTSKEVQDKLNEKYEGKIPYDETVISPAKMLILINYYLLKKTNLRLLTACKRNPPGMHLHAKRYMRF